MADPTDRTQQAHDKWREAELTYADLLAHFDGDGSGGKALKQSALDLAAARSKADSARDKFFKRALKR